MNKALILSLLIGGMCGNISIPIAIQPATAAPSSKLERSLAAAPATVEVITLGAEPRRELKFRPAANSTQTMVMTMGMTMDIKVDNDAMPKTPIPKMVIKIDLNVQKVDPAGDIYYSFAYGDIKVVAEKDTPPAMLAAMQKSLKSLAGIRGNLVVNSSGLMKSKNFVLPKTIEPTMRDTFEQFTKSLDQVSTQLPTGMLGVGGRWRVNNAIESGGIKFNQSALYEIVEINDTEMTVQAKVTQSAPPQDIKLPKAGKGAQAKLTTLDSVGEGQYRIKFDSMLPISGKLLLNTNSKMSIKVSPKEPFANMVTNIAIDLKMADK